jgi:hypothetical protein
MNSSTLFSNAFKIKTSIFSIFNILEIHNYPYLVTLAYRLAMDFSLESKCLCSAGVCLWDPFTTMKKKRIFELKHLITSNDAL